MNRLLLILLLALASSVFGYDLKLLDGTVYEDMRLLDKNDGGIRIIHASGIVSLNYKKLQPADARTFGYDEFNYQTWLNSKTTARAEAEPQPVVQSAPVRPMRPARAYVAPAPEPAPSRTTTSTTGTRSGQCTAYTKKGYRCSRMAAAGSSTCWQH